MTPTSAKQRSSKQYQSTPNIESSANASSRTREDVRSKLEKEIEEKYIEGLPFDIFMEDYLQSPGIFSS